MWRFCTCVHIVQFYVFVTNGVNIKDWELYGTSNEAELRYAYFSVLCFLRKTVFRRLGVSCLVDAFWRFSILTNIANISTYSQTCSKIYTYIGGDTRDIAEPTYKGFNQLLDENPTAHKGFNQLQGFQPTTKVSTNLLDKNPTAYKTQILPTGQNSRKSRFSEKKKRLFLGMPKKCF